MMILQNDFEIKSQWLVQLPYYHVERVDQSSTMSTFLKLVDVDG